MRTTGVGAAVGGFWERLCTLTRLKKNKTKQARFRWFAFGYRCVKIWCRDPPCDSERGQPASRGRRSRKTVGTWAPGDATGFPNPPALKLFYHPTCTVRRVFLLIKSFEIRFSVFSAGKKKIAQAHTYSIYQIYGCVLTHRLPKICADLHSLQGCQDARVPPYPFVSTR